MQVYPFILVVLSALLHGGWNFVAKRAPQKLEIPGVGMFIAVLLFAPGLLWEESWPTLQGNVLGVLTGILQWFYLALLYRAYHAGGLTLVYPLSRGVGLIFTFILEMIFYQHPFNGMEIMGISLVSVGTSFLSIPSLKTTERKAVLWSVFIGFILSIAFILGRFSTGRISAFTYLWEMTLVTVVMIFLSLGKNRLPKFQKAFREHQWPALMIGIGAFLSYLLVVFLFKTIPAATVISIRELSVVFGCTLGFIYLNEKMTPLKVVSILCIVTGAILLKFK